MTTLDLGKELDQKIVDGILKGYKEYLDVRRNAKNKLAVSTAYAWVKGNHIDSCVKEMFSGNETMKSSVEKAGYVWEYLLFQLQHEQDNYLIIVKNSRAMSKTFAGKSDKINEENYLYAFSGINNSLIKSGKLSAIRQSHSVQLELSFPELELMNQGGLVKTPKGFNRFYVVTYEIDDSSKMISKISLTLPDRNEMLLVEVADLTPLIESSTIDISSDELEIVKNDKVASSIYGTGDREFGYAIAAEEKDENNKAK